MPFRTAQNWGPPEGRDDAVVAEGAALLEMNEQEMQQRKRTHRNLMSSDLIH